MKYNTQKRNKVTESKYEMTALEKNIVHMVQSQFKDDDLVNVKKRYFLSIQELKNRLKELGEEITLEQI